MDPKLISWCPLRIASGPLRWLYLVSFLFFLQIDDWICARKTKKSKKKSNEIEMWSFHNYSLRCYESYKTRAFITCICMYVHSSPKIKHKILKALSKTTWGDWYVGHASTHQLPQVLYEVSHSSALWDKSNGVGEKHEHDSATLVLSHLPFQNSPHCDTDLNCRYHDARK